jgi:hypothetical protein
MYSVSVTYEVYSQAILAPEMHLSHAQPFEGGNHEAFKS